MMTKLLWRATAVLLVIGALAAVPLLLSHDSHSQSAAAKAVTARLAHAAVLERERGEEAGGARTREAYTDRAYPGAEVSIDEIQGAIAANDEGQAQAARSWARSGTSSAPTRSTSTGSAPSRSSSRRSGRAA